MRILSNLFGGRGRPIQSYEEFWTWFRGQERKFHQAVRGVRDLEEDFFDKLRPRLHELNEGLWFVTGMHDPHTAELVITADGNIRNFVMVEELVQAAPKIEGWKFSALKPPMEIESVFIEMSGHAFHEKSMRFFSTHDPNYPDEIDITVVHNEYTEKNSADITNGVYIFLDNYLGELNFAVSIDRLTVAGPSEAKWELIPIVKLKDYLKWREKEFIEKYKGTRLSTENDQYSVMEAELEDGQKLVATINTDLLRWEGKASHPWILQVDMHYDGSFNWGMPDKETFRQLNEVESRILENLQDQEGYLYIGRQTAQNKREIYFACREFRKPSRVLCALQKEYEKSREIKYDIFKDKYWRSLARFDPAL